MSTDNVKETLNPGLGSRFKDGDNANIVSVTKESIENLEDKLYQKDPYLKELEPLRGIDSWTDTLGIEEDQEKITKENEYLRAKIKDLKMRINVFKSDYNLMSFQLKDLTGHSIEACLERMEFRKPLFENLDGHPSECFYE